VAEYIDGQILFANDINSITRSLRKVHVIRGWEVTESATPDLNTNVAPGSGYINGTVVETTTTTTLAHTPDTVNPKKDLIIWNSATGALEVVAGTPAEVAPAGETDPRKMTSPAPPAPPNADDIIIAEVYVPANATAITNAEIFDKRNFGVAYVKMADIDPAILNAANGLVQLDSGALVPLAQIPNTLTGKDADTVDTLHAQDLIKRAYVMSMVVG